MIQQINLFDPSLKKEKKYLTAQSTVGSIVVMLLAIGLIYYQQYTQIQTLTLRLAIAKTAENEQKKRLDEINIRFPAKKIDQNISKTIELRQAKYNLQTRLEKKLSESTFGAQGKGFADYLSGMARYHQPGLWITEFNFSEGGRTLSIQGGTKNPDLLPSYMEALRAASAFDGKTFKTFEMTRVDNSDGELAFHIHSNWIPPVDKKELPAEEQPITLKSLVESKPPESKSVNKNAKKP